MAKWHLLGWGPAISERASDELNVQRLMTMSRHQPVAAGAHIVNSLLLTWLAWPATQEHLALAVLQIFMLVSSALQLRSWFRHRDKPPPLKVSDRTINRAIVWGFVFGLTWGLYGVVLFGRTNAPEIDLVTCVVFAGMMAGGTTMLYTIPLGMAAFLVGIGVPMEVTFLMRGDHVGAVLAAYMVIYVACLVLAGRAWHLNFVENVTLRLKNTELAFSAETASRAKSLFLANMSHELRTPLNAIVGFADMISRQYNGPVGNPAYIEFANAIHDSGVHLGEVIDDILDLSKIESGKVDLTEETRSAASVIDEALVLVRPAIEKAKLEVAVTAEPNLPEVRMDARRMRQCLINILSNAVKFTPEGGRIRVEVRRAAAGGGVLIMVSDTGVGIGADELDEVKKPFVQGRAAVSRRTRGTGLGLAIAEQLIELHGGTLTLTSAQGEGTVVTIHLPGERTVAALPIQAAG